MGDNGLLINEKYSSFVFVGECITSLTPKQLGLKYADEEEMRTCLHCGRCASECPAKCIKTDEKWFGMTYAEDVEAVKASLREYVDKGVYAEKLWC